MELSRGAVLKPCCRKAEVAPLRRFAGGLHLAAVRIMFEAELDTGVAGARFRTAKGEASAFLQEALPA